MKAALNTSLTNIIYTAVPNASIYDIPFTDKVIIAVDSQEDATTIGIILALHS